jgi:hypothetical protein
MVRTIGDLTAGRRAALALCGGNIIDIHID